MFVKYTDLLLSEKFLFSPLSMMVSHNSIFFVLWASNILLTTLRSSKPNLSYAERVAGREILSSKVGLTGQKGHIFQFGLNALKFKHIDQISEAFCLLFIDW